MGGGAEKWLRLVLPAHLFSGSPRGGALLRYPA